MLQTIQLSAPVPGAWGMHVVVGYLEDHLFMKLYHLDVDACVHMLSETEKTKRRKRKTEKKEQCEYDGNRMQIRHLQRCQSCKQKKTRDQWKPPKEERTQLKGKRRAG